MSGVVYKQWFKARADPKAPDSNVRHLQYIATRPGTEFNRGCGFGLWGQPPGAAAITEQMNLAEARQILRDASKKHTVYRAVISVDKKDAQAHGLYRKENWEALLRRQINTIAQELQIKPQHFCWYASTHREKNHPHTHIVFWDNSDEPRCEFIPKDEFKIRTERIRAAFSGDLNKENILALQQQQQAELKTLRATLQEICLEANPEKMINIKKLYRSDELSGLSKELTELLRELPPRGSLRYAYLPEDYKEKVNAFLTKCMTQLELEKEVKQYKRLTAQISKLYGNDRDGQAIRMANAEKKLQTALGNALMDVLREIKDDILHEPVIQDPELAALLREAAAEVAPELDSYRTMAASLPRNRIPVSEMYNIAGFREEMNRTIDALLSDARLRLRMENYALEKAGIDPLREDEPENGEEGSGYRFRGKNLTDAEWKAYRQAYAETVRELRQEVIQQLREEADWPEEAARTGTVSALSCFMSILSQLVYQHRASLPRVRANDVLSRDRSREAAKDLRTIRQQGSGLGEQ